MSHNGLSTAGAIPVLNQKGQVSMLKVKVQRYVSGRVPKYAHGISDSDSDDEEFNDQLVNEKKQREKNVEDIKPLVFYNPDYEKYDRRLQRLNNREIEESKEYKKKRHRQIVEPEILAIKDEDDDKGEDDEMDEENVEKRHAKLKQKRLREEEELLGLEEEGGSESEEDEEEDEESEYEESDSETDAGPRLKPVFVRKKDRITIEDKKNEELKKREAEFEAKRAAEERKKQALKIIEEETKREMLEKEKTEEEQMAASIAAINTDDEEEEVSYESWKLRELKRTKRDKEEREALIKEKEDVERIRTMTEEERQAEFKARPKTITNEAPRGKYKFLQKYYHRGAFFLNEDDEVLKRDFTEPTLEDHFDKTVLPKIMQVKNFGRSGRTKYTHLVDQDTTAFDSPWALETGQTSKFHSTQAGGMKQVFEKPTKKRK